MDRATALPDELSIARERLKKTSAKLRRSAIVAVTTTTMVMLICITLVVRSLGGSLFVTAAASWLAVLAALELALIAAIVAREYAVRKVPGVQVYVADVLSTAGGHAEEAELKFASNQLSADVDLPLAPGRHGAWFYVAINLLMVAATLYFAFAVLYPPPP